MKKELIKPTKIYVKEILSLLNNNLINGCANITGGGLEDNIKRIIPNNLCAEIDLNKLKPLRVFKWLKKNNLDDQEMLKKLLIVELDFCLVVDKMNLNKISKYFSREFKPYIIGKI